MSMNDPSWPRVLFAMALPPTARAHLFIRHQPGVPLRSTPGFMLPPAARVCTTLATSALLLVLAIHGYATRHERLIEAWRPTHFNVSIKLDDRLTEITKARTEITVEVLRDKVTIVDLDFGEMEIDGVTVDGKTAKFDRSPGRLNVQLSPAAPKGSRFIVAVDYHGRPKDGLILTNDKDGKASATGDNWPDRVHHWIPCLDHPSAKATVSFTITAPAKDLVVANGRLGQVTDDSPTTRTWTYTEGVPIPAYCMVIAVGDYAKSEPTTPAITPLTYYVPQSDGKFAIRGFAAAAPTLKFFSETIAPYPYEKLAMIVGATRFGGMENSSAIVFASTLLNPQAGSPLLSRAFNIPERLEDVEAHEIAHQWFGDSVTESTWADLWLSEGFATYFAGLVIEKYDGVDAFRAYMKRAAEAYFNYEKTTRTPIHDTETDDLFKLLNPNNYQKGAWVLHMLRSTLGDDAFIRGLRAYYKAHESGTATSDDLRTALEKASGRDLKQFFARWVYGSGHPTYELSWYSPEYSGAGGTIVLILKQTQPGDAFLDPVPIEVTSGSTSRRLRIEPTGKMTIAQFHFNANEAPTFVLLDPDDTLLKEVMTNIKQVKPVGP